MKTRQSEYTVDRLNEQITILEDQVKHLVKENEELYSEGKFGSLVSLVVGIAIGMIIGTVSVWLS